MKLFKINILSCVIFINATVYGICSTNENLMLENESRSIEISVNTQEFHFSNPMISMDSAPWSTH